MSSLQIPLFLRLSRSLTAVTCTTLLFGSVAWSQPAQPEDKETKKREELQQKIGAARQTAAKQPAAQHMRVRVTAGGADGAAAVTVLDGNGNPINVTAPAAAAPRLIAPRAGRLQGSLAVTDKYVYVLLNGTLYQYDPDTLELLKHIRVTPPRPEPAKKKAPAVIKQ